MEKRRHGRGRLHDFGQPAMGRKLSGLERRRQRQKARRQDGEAAAFSRMRRFQDRADIAGAIGQREHGGRADERDIAKARGDELLARRALRSHPIGVEQQQPVQKKAGADPGKDQLNEIAGGDEQQHRGERQTEPAGERTLPRFSVQVGRGVADDDPTDKGDQKQHRGADGVETHRQASAINPDYRTDARSEQDPFGKRDQRGKERKQSSRLGQFGEKFRSATRVQKADRRADDQRNGRQQRRESDWHERPLRLAFRFGKHGSGARYAIKIHCCVYIIRLNRTI